MSDRYQTTVAGRFVIQPASTNLFDHVVAARKSATRGETAWIKCRADPSDALQFKVHAGALHVTPLACKVGWIHAWNDVPTWMLEARRINDRLASSNPQGATHDTDPQAADPQPDPPESAQPAA